MFVENYKTNKLSLLLLDISSSAGQRGGDGLLAVKGGKVVLWYDVVEERLQHLRNFPEVFQKRRDSLKIWNEKALSPWPVAAEIAKNVSPGINQGRPRKNKTTNNGKKSYREFGELINMSDQTVANKLRTWNRASEDGLVPHSDSLSPDSVLSVDWELLTHELWNKYKDAGLGENAVYLIGFLDHMDWPLKIGKAKSVPMRLETLQCASPWELEVFMVLRGSTKLERELHRQFSDRRTRKGGEWFDLTSDDIELIRRTRPVFYDRGNR